MAGKIVVKFYGLLRRQVQPPVLEITTAELNILQLLQLAERRTGRNFLDELLDPEKKLLTGTIILVNSENIRLKQNLETLVHGGDSIDLFSPAGGG